MIRFRFPLIAITCHRTLVGRCIKVARSKLLTKYLVIGSILRTKSVDFKKKNVDNSGFRENYNKKGGKNIYDR